MKQEFMDAVYSIVSAIPSGEVRSYGEVARLAGFPAHARHVGKLMSNLPPNSRLPWHRVVRSDGTLAVGEEQAARLRAEGLAVNGLRVSRALLRNSS